MADLVSVKEISINKQILAGSVSLNYGDAPKQFLNPNGIAQDVNLQVSPPTATSFLILNIGSSGTLEVKVNSVLIKSVEASAAVSVVYDGFQWQIIETGDGGSGTASFSGAKVVAMADIVLSSNSQTYQYIDPNGSDRAVVLTDPPTDQDFFYIVNLTGTHNLNIKETASGATVQVLNNYVRVAQCHFLEADNTWYIMTFGSI